MPAPPLSRDKAQAAVDALRQAGGVRTEAAKILGIPVATLRSQLARAAEYGLFDPAEFVAPAKPLSHGLGLKGISEYVRTETGGQWIKADRDEQERLRALEAAVAALSDDVPRARKMAPPRHAEAQLCNVYTLTDCHVGMLAWHREGGADWDLKIAEDTLTGCFGAMVSQSPKAASCVVAQLGDFLHWDGLEAVTPTGGHNLDADGRFEKVTGVAIRILRRVIDYALQKHHHVHVLMAEGNHDLASSIWLRKIFAALYENEPRVSIDTSPLPYYAFQWGETALFWHHGHKKKFDKLPGLFAAQFPKIWGETTKRYGHTGHFHSEKTFEENGIKMRQHATLAARDAYAARGGWISAQEAKSFTYHRRTGEVGSVTVTPEMLEDVA